MELTLIMAVKSLQHLKKMYLCTDFLSNHNDLITSFFIECNGDFIPVFHTGIESAVNTHFLHFDA